MTEAAAADKALADVGGACSFCGAKLRPGDTQCWLCRAPVFVSRSSSISRPNRTSIERTGGFSLASLMMFVTLLSVVFGLSTIVPGVGIPLGVLLMVAWGHTVSMSRRRAALGMPLTSSQQMKTYLSSFGFVVAMLLIVTVAVFIALGSICFGFVSAVGLMGAGPAYQIGLLIVTVAGLFAAFGLLRLAGKWNDSQWRRMTDRDRESSNDRKKP